MWSIHIKPVIQHAVAIFFDVGCCIALTTLSTAGCRYLKGCVQILLGWGTRDKDTATWKWWQMLSWRHMLEMSVQKQFISLWLFVLKNVLRHCDCTQVCVPQMLSGHGCNTVQEHVHTWLIYTCKRWGLPAAGLLLSFAEADPKMMVLRFVLFSPSSKECSTWPLTKEFASPGPPAPAATGQFPINPEQRICTSQLYLLWRPLQTHSTIPWRWWDPIFAYEKPKAET